MTSRSTLLCLGLCLAAFAATVGACATPAVVECGNTGVLCPSGTHCAALQGICIPDSNTCGDGRHDPGEVCEDGNTLDGDGCSRDCMSDETCGNHITDLARHEVCDDGNNVDGDKCSHDCLSLETCGNNIKDKGEACDDGNNIDADGCSHNCLSDERCGNGITDDEIGEVCDPPTAGTCGPDCRSLLKCGNGIRDLGEECDLGQSNNGDDKDCRSDCVFNRCGDGFANTHGADNHEDCDAAPKAVENDHKAVPTETALCNIDCTTPSCGDGKVNRSFTPDGASGTEQCDIKNGNADTKECTAHCQIAVCGDHLTNSIGPRFKESCDDGNRDDADDCTNACIARSCGDGIVAGPPEEECDLGDGNSNTGACLRSCKIAVCGDGEVRVGVEECDGADVNGVHCTPPSLSAPTRGCRLQECGNGIIDPTEECDNGPANSNNADCRSDCIINRCGDGHQNTAGTQGHREPCEARATPVPDKSPLVTPIESASCNVNCTIPACGDNIVNHRFQPVGAPGFEQCDDDGTAPDDGCSAVCQFERCGDGIIQPPEECDIADVGGVHCSSSCHLQKCNNGIIDPNEQCDDGNGHNGAGQRCNANCKFNVCGDGDKAGAEECDKGTIVGGFPTPRDTADCDSDCTLPVCGDGHPNLATTTEQCDDGNGSNEDDCTNGCKTAFCGDSFLRSTPGHVEECDTALGPSSCDYDPDSQPCSVCVACSLTHPAAPFCGDGHTDDPFETCDSGSTSPHCGSCSGDCQTVTLQQAVGFIVAAAGKDLNPSAVLPNDTFAVFDGFSLLPTTFEFTNSAVTTPGNIAIGFSTTSTDNTATASAIVTAINARRASGLQIVATRTGSVVTLTNQRFSSLGNGVSGDQRLSESVQTSNFAVVEMNGGQGGNCPLTSTCANNEDCASHNCSTTTHVCL